MNLLLKQELKRKAIHMSSMWIPILYYITNFEVTLALLAFLTPFVASLDLLRHKNSKLGAQVRELTRLLYLENILRLHEKRGSLSGASYMLISALLCILVFSKNLFIIAFTVLIIADTCAALAGLSFGRTKIIGSKTVAGTFTFFGVSSIIAIHMSNYFGLDTRHAFIAAGVATIAELLSVKLRIDDNLLIPLVYGFWFILMDGL